MPCTVIQLDRCQVTQVKLKENGDNTDSIQVGCGEQITKRTCKAQAGHFLKNGLPIKRHMTEFPVTKENLLPVGYMLSPRHFHIG